MVSSKQVEEMAAELAQAREAVRKALIEGAESSATAVRGNGVP